MSKSEIDARNRAFVGSVGRSSCEGRVWDEAWAAAHAYYDTPIGELLSGHKVGRAVNIKVVAVENGSVILEDPTGERLAFVAGDELRVPLERGV